MQVFLVWITLMADEDPFFAACRKGETEQVRVALSEGEDPNKVDQNGNPAVVLAAGAGHLGVVELLLALPGVRVNEVDQQGWTALHEAAQYGHAPVVEVLLAHPDIRVNKVDQWGWTALHIAARNGHAPVVEFLLNHPDTQRGIRALHLAESNLEILNLEILVELKQRREERMRWEHFENFYKNTHFHVFTLIVPGSKGGRWQGC